MKCVCWIVICMVGSWLDVTLLGWRVNCVLAEGSQTVVPHKHCKKIGQTSSMWPSSYTHCCWLWALMLLGMCGCYWESDSVQLIYAVKTRLAYHSVTYENNHLGDFCKAPFSQCSQFLFVPFSKPTITGVCFKTPSLRPETYSYVCRCLARILRICFIYLICVPLLLWL